jgi:hypothetical protein
MIGVKWRQLVYLLGHHRSLIKLFIPADPPPETPPELLELKDHHQQLLEAQVHLLNLAIKNLYTYHQWHKVVNFLLAKEPGSPRCHKLRVIHLCEADLNLLIGVKWQQLVHHVTDHQLIPPWQCGGFSGRDAHTPVLMDITRTSRQPLLRMGFDASS